VRVTKAVSPMITAMIQTSNNVVMWTSLQTRKYGVVNSLLKVIHNILSLGRCSADT